MRKSKMLRSLALGLTTVLMLTGVALAADLKVDLIAGGGIQQNKDLGSVVGGDSISFDTGVFFRGGPSTITSVTFDDDGSLPSFVTGVTSETVTRASGNGDSTTALSTITVEAPCTLGEFGDNDAAKIAAAAVQYSATSMIKNGVEVSPVPSDDVGTGTAWVNITGNVTSLGANCGSADTTDPTITITTPADEAVYTLNESVLADYACEDETGGSGLASCIGDVDDGDAIDTSTVGTHTFTVDAEDNAGNTSALTHTYYVQYAFVGFDRPVDNNGVYNVVKAGQGVPLKFKVEDIDGIGITGLTAPPVFVKVSNDSCELGTSGDLVEEVAAGQSGLQDLGYGYYNFVWKTPKSYADSCKKLTLNLGDGNTSHTALFKFTK